MTRHDRYLLQSCRSLSAIENTASALISIFLTTHWRALGIADLGVVTAGLYPRDAQPLVVIDFLILVRQCQSWRSIAAFQPGIAGTR